MDAREVFEENYPDIAHHLEGLDHAYTITISPNSLTICDAFVNLRLSKRDLKALQDYSTPSNHNLTYIGSSGIRTGNYSEFFIELGHPDYLYLPDGEWPATRPLTFRLGTALVRIGNASPLIVFLTEPPFKDSDCFPSGFSALCSVQLRTVSAANAAELAHKAIFYLNAHYLQPIGGLYARVRSVAVDFDDPLDVGGVTQKDFKARFESVLRSRTRGGRQDFKTIQPLKLFNNAVQARGTMQFLEFYRILEFFMHRGTLNAIEEIRYDKTASAEELLKAITARNEADQLNHLVTRLLTRAEMRRLLGDARTRGLVSDGKPESLVKALYVYRNSVIHAKETEIARATVADPFAPDRCADDWNCIVRYLAERAIRRLNT